MLFLTLILIYEYRKKNVSSFELWVFELRVERSQSKKSLKILNLRNFLFGIKIKF